MSWVFWVRRGVGRRRPLLLTAALVSAGCQQLLGIEDLSTEKRPGTGGTDGSGGAGGSQGGTANAGAMPDVDGGEQLPPYLPEGGTCVAGVPARCTSANGREGLCTAGTCTEYCILDQSLLDQCLMR